MVLGPIDQMAPIFPYNLTMENANFLNMETDFDHSPSFFRIMHGDLHSEKLRILPDFVKHIPEKAATLRASGSVWKVQCTCSKGGIYLQDGWQEFIRDNSFGDDEFLIFRYYGDMCFNVQIFDKTGLERTNIANSKRHQPDLPNGKRPRGRPRIIKEKEHIQKGSGTDEIDLRVLQMDLDSKHGSAKVWEEKAESFTSKNPYFTAYIRKASVETARIQVIPTAFCRENFPKHTFKVVLKNLKGKSWEVNSVFAMEKHSLCGGWFAFARDNNLKIGDVCIFELVATKEMLVHIFSD